MAGDRLFAEVLQELYEGRMTGAYFITVKEASEDLFKIYTKQGEIVAVTYGTASGQDALDILEYYTLQNGTFFAGMEAAGGIVPSKYPIKKFIERMRKAHVMIRVA